MNIIQWIRINLMLTFAELPEYIRRVEKLMSASERLDIINYLAAHPKSGDLIEGTGGYASCDGGVVHRVSPVVFGSFTTFTAT